MSYEPLHHKYRPQTFKDLVGQDAISQTLINAINTNRIAPAYLFTGPRGTGKTSSARILAKSLNCQASDKPTPTPCGICEVCKAIARSSALDVIEIDAASNTGVDNIREIIERSQFAPVQCRYKVYVIDECLTGDSLVLTREGLMRLDNPNIKGKMVLSYNETTGVWEYKKVLRWLNQGIKQTLVIKTTNRVIRCTQNHLIRTDQGWIRAQDVKEGMKILSPVNVDVVRSFTNMGQMDVSVDLLEDTNFKAINTGRNFITWMSLLNKQNLSVPCAAADVEKSSIFPPFCNEKVMDLKVLNHTGNNTLTKKDTELGIVAQKTSSPMLPFYLQISLGLFTEHYSEMEVSTTQTYTADFLDYVGLIANNNDNGSSIKPVVYQNYTPNYGSSLIKDMVSNQSIVEQPAIPNLEMFLQLSNLIEIKNSFPWTGLTELPQKDWLGGIWMTDLSVLPQQAVYLFNYTQKDILTKKINLFPTGLQNWAILPQQNPIQEKLPLKPTTTPDWGQKQLENGYQTSKNTQFPLWTTNLETVESIQYGQKENVYDIEVENNHNFVANGLTVHNCHMLSVAAFNALLKTLEEPPNRVVFVLATTDPQRVLPTIISRCQRFDYRRIPLEDMVKHLKYIASKENINIDDQAITLVGQIANGGLRDAESLLDQLSLLSGTVTPDRVWDLVGAIPELDLLKLIKAIRSKNPETILDCCRHLMNRGKEPLTVLQNLAGFYLNLVIAKTAPIRSDLVAVTAATWKELCQEAQQWQLEEILQGQQHLKDSEVQLKNTTQPRLWLEVTLLGLLSVGVSFGPSIEQKPVNGNNGKSNPNNLQTNDVKPTSEVTPPPEPKPIQESLPPEPATPEPTPEEPVIIPENNQPSDDLAQLWQKVLQHLQPPTTQALFSQQGHLVSFDGLVAIIGVGSENLLKLHKSKIPNLEAAFKAIYQQPVKVNLQLINPNKSSETAPEKQAKDYQFSSSVDLDKDVPPSDESAFTDPKINNNNNGKHLEVQPPSTPEPEPIPPSVDSNREIPIDLPLSTNNIESNYSDNEIQKAVESLLKIFEGEIVNIESTIEEDLKIKPEQSSINNNPITTITEHQEPIKKQDENTGLIKGRPDISDKSEDELDF